MIKQNQLCFLFQEDQIAVWGDWVNKSEIEHAEAMRRHANLPSSTSKSVVQTTEQEIVYYEFEVSIKVLFHSILVLVEASSDHITSDVISIGAQKHFSKNASNFKVLGCQA